MLLLNIMVVKSIFRLHAWIKWLPPIAAQFPSPVTTITVRDGLATFIPVANANALPCVV